MKKTVNKTWLALLIFAAALLSNSVDAQVRYRLEVDNTWSEETHPGAFPEQAHFSWFGGATHDASVSFWDEGALADAGITQMAEDGSTFLLMDYVEFERERGKVGSPLSYRWWFCPSATNAGNCGKMIVEFEIKESWPLVTLVSMLGPSPDWFVGVSGLPLRDDGRWIRELVVELRPHDAGTRSSNRWLLFGPREDPPLPIRQISEVDGLLVGPGVLGTLTFTLLTEMPRRVPGDCNEDGRFDISDAICTLEALFSEGPARLPCGKGSSDAPGNLQLLDWQPDGSVDISDAISMLLHLFGSGPAHHLAVSGSSGNCTPIEDCGASICP